MTDAGGRWSLRYLPLPADGRAPRYLVAAPGTAEGDRFPFAERIEIGRDDEGRELKAGLLLVPDPTVSRHHCVVTQRSDGRCFVRDTSRNGTRLDGRRLVPGVETEWRPGQAISVGTSRDFRLEGAGATDAWSSLSGAAFATIPRPDRTIATVLVGDIRDYTVLVRRALSEDLQAAVRRVFEGLSAAVQQQGGTVKEYQGDAILAFWEGDVGGGQAARACRAAMALDALTARFAADRSVWPVEDFPLQMEWALATGIVLIDSFGRGQPLGLSMMGEPVVRAFRIEKFASAETGRIVACPATRAMAGEAFAFRDLGEKQAKGFDRPDRVYALLGEASAGAPLGHPRDGPR